MWVIVFCRIEMLIFREEYGYNECFWCKIYTVWHQERFMFCRSLNKVPKCIFCALHASLWQFSGLPNRYGYLQYWFWDNCNFFQVMVQCKNMQSFLKYKRVRKSLSSCTGDIAKVLMKFRLFTCGYRLPALSQRDGCCSRRKMEWKTGGVLWGNQWVW